MPDVTFTCEHCGQPLAADDEHVGHDIACPSCGNAMTVPRARAQLKIKGRGTTRATAARAEPAENLSSLAVVTAFGDERAALLARRRRARMLMQTIAATGMTAMLLAVGIAGWRMHQRQKADRRRRAAEDQRQLAEDARQRALRSEAAAMNHKARERDPWWSLTNEDCYELWRCLNDLAGNRADAGAWFDEWVRADAEMCGLLCEQFRLVARPDDIEPACLRLAGAAFGLHNDGQTAVPLPWLARFRQAAARKVTPPR